MPFGFLNDKQHCYSRGEFRLAGDGIPSALHPTLISRSSDISSISPPLTFHQHSNLFTPYFAPKLLPPRFVFCISRRLHTPLYFLGRIKFYFSCTATKYDPVAFLYPDLVQANFSHPKCKCDRISFREIIDRAPVVRQKPICLC